MLDSIYHMTLKLLNKITIGHKNVKILSSFTQRHSGRHYVKLLNLSPTSGLSILLYGVISLQGVTSCDNYVFYKIIVCGSDWKH